jgi:hypothetical protein
LAKPKDGLVPYERYLELMKFLEQKAETEFKTRVGRDELDAAHAARLDAEIKLLDARQAASGQQRPSAAVEAPRSTEIPASPGAKSPQPPASHPRPLPALLTAEPLNAAAGDDERKKLLKERYNAALKSLKSAFQPQVIEIPPAGVPAAQLYEATKRGLVTSYKEARNTSLSISFAHMIAAARQLLAADVSLHKSGATYERYFELMKFLDDTATSVRKSGLVDTATCEAVHQARLDAEVKLLDARGGTAPEAVPVQAPGDPGRR